VAIGMVLATAAVLLLGWEVRRVLTWIVVAALLAVVLGPVVDLAERRLRLRRAVATLLVFLLFLVALVGIVTVFIRPLATEGPEFIDRLPGYVEDAREGRGPVGGLIQRYNLDQWLERNQGRLQESTNRITEPALGVLRSIFSTVVALVTIFVLTFLMFLQGPKLLASWIAALPEDRQERVRRVAADCSKAVTGYMTGNLVISAIAGTLTYIVLWIIGVPYKGVVALFVGFADLIPLVGATLGAIVAIGVAALHSLPAALVVLVFFVVYQQAENHRSSRPSCRAPSSCRPSRSPSPSCSGSSCWAFWGRCWPSRSPGSCTSSAATCMTATAAASSPTQPPAPTRSRCRSPGHWNPANSSPATSPPTTHR
jgi:predicted PurR-regulated permease PerM